MAEEFLQQGGVCGESWWNSPRNLFMSSSPCSLGWATHDELIMEMKSVRSTGDGNSSLLVQDVRQPINSDHWRRNQDLLWRDSGGSEENDSNFLLDSSMLMKNSNLSEEQAAGFPMSSTSTSTSTYSLLQTLFDTDSQSLVHNQSNSNGFLAGLQPKPSPTTNRLPLTNNAPLWNSTASTTQSHFLPSSPSLTINRNLIHDIHSTAAKQQQQQQQQREEGNKDLATVVKKTSNEPAFKRQRIETPSPLPTFKVRKEKLGDRVTALQQLVSPFGKTDTASVLHEAIEYIKFLHDQVNALSTPYLKYGSPPVQRQKGDKEKDKEGVTKDLKGRGLCLVPISSTFPVAAETTTDFWTPSFTGSFS